MFERSNDGQHMSVIRRNPVNQEENGVRFGQFAMNISEDIQGAKTTGYFHTLGLGCQKRAVNNFVLIYSGMLFIETLCLAIFT